LSEHRFSIWLTLLVAGVVALVGCRSQEDFRFRQSTEHFQAVATQIEYPDVNVAHREELFDTPAPRTVADTENIQYWPMTLEEAISTALANSQVIRDAGGMILGGPTPGLPTANVATVYDPAIRDTDPRTGVEAALSAFDAQLGASMSLAQRDRQLGSFLFFDPSELIQDGGIFQGQLSKTGAAGTQFSLSNYSAFEHVVSGSPTSDSYLTLFQGQIRQPLLQGAGIEYNRIAGPNGRPGLYNGVVLARINTDIGLADFEQSVNGLLTNVERAYWDLYVTYRDLDAKLAAREMALTTWRNVHSRYQAGAADQEEEARAREQFYLFNSAVLNSLNGIPTPVSAAQLAAGPANGVYALDRRLRWLLGLPPSDGRLIRPADEPSTGHVKFEWQESLREALCRRVELRKQKWNIKRRQLELIAAHNMTRVRLDAVGQYRMFGVGRDLLLDDDLGINADFQQWQLGLQLATPLGNRIGHNAERNAELLVAREKAIYRDQELRVVHELSDAQAELERAYAVSRSNFNAGLAAYQHLQEVGKKYDAGVIPLEFLLDAQRRVVEANSAYYRSLIDYNVAIANFQGSRGTLLEYHQVQLAEGPWTDEAYVSAAKQARRFKPRVLDYTYEAAPVSQGVFERRPSAQDGGVSEATAPEKPLRRPPVDAAEVLPAPIPEPPAPTKAKD
jgi:outer membrane protein TolC